MRSRGACRSSRRIASRSRATWQTSRTPADLRGAIAGGVFIEAFVQGFPWAHLDIAGTAWSDGERPYLSKGGTGYGVRLLVDLLRQTADAVPRTA